MQHPVQPLYTDDKGTVRFKQNAIVRFLLDAGPYDMNQIALMPFNQEDREQFAQLIGYSLSGFSELSYVSDETYERASKQSPQGTYRIWRCQSCGHDHEIAKTETEDRHEN